jgi:hypothetical protein
VDARLGRRHPDHAEERAQRNLSALLIAAEAGVRVELPFEDGVLTLVDTEALIEWRVPAACVGDAPRPDPHLVDPHLQRLSGSRSAHLDGADERVTGVALVTIGRTEFEAVARYVAPAGVQARERDRVSRLDRQDRLEVAGEVAVERAPLEWDLVQRH